MTRRRSQKRTPTGHFTSSWKLPSRVSWSKEGETSAIVLHSKQRMGESALFGDAAASRRRLKTPSVISILHPLLNMRSRLLFCSKQTAYSVGCIGNRQTVSPNGLANHEKSVHNETRSSRMDTFKPFFEQPRRKCLFLMAYDLVFMKCRPYACKSVNGITAV